MPLWVAALAGAFLQAVGSFVGRILVSLGLGLVVYQGLDTALTWFGDQISQHLNNVTSLGATATSLAGVLQVGTCANIFLSALAVRMILRGVTAGAKKAWVHK